MGSALAAELSPNAPVPVFMEKEAWTLNVFMGAVCAGCFYTLVEPELPVERVPAHSGDTGCAGAGDHGKIKRKSRRTGISGKDPAGRRSGTDGSEPVTSGSPQKRSL